MYKVLTDVAVHVAHVRGDGVSEHEGVAGARARVARDHAERAGLARAVDAQQPEALAFAHRCTD